jgi:hypothetical protein
MKSAFVSFFAALALFGCETETLPTSATSTSGEPPFTLDPESTSVALTPDEAVLANQPARLQLDQLSASMTRIAGTDVHGQPIEWRVNGKNGFSDEVFGKALGRPDFQSTTEEQTVSSALYLKFVGDAARAICTDMAKNDLLRTDPTSRSLFPKASVDAEPTDAEITDNLRFLALKFLGLRLDQDARLIVGLKAVYEAGAAEPVPEGAQLNARAEGWRGVCVALFEHPLFHNN